ncbi:flavodoxin domain-containing protein [Nocardia carnea]|uniref:flavodoxin domain-containing protein n=1 Tax=Nocardia carnea TaxID=37328 RepID=UPI002458E617|nr:flavodoxin domain-containing protein [Nocardia carnea]
MTSTNPRIAVIYATEQGSTRDIAEFIAGDLAERGAEVELHDIEHAPEPSRFDAVVLGSAVHDMDFLPAATAYLRNHRDMLARTDLRLFSVGLGPALRGPIGRRLGRMVPPKIDAIRKTVSAADYHAFAGHYERVGVSLRARILYRLLGGGRYGDLRDWADIRSWSAEVAAGLGLPSAKSSITRP